MYNNSEKKCIWHDIFIEYVYSFEWVLSTAALSWLNCYFNKYQGDTKCIHMHFHFKSSISVWLM